MSESKKPNTGFYIGIGTLVVVTIGVIGAIIQSRSLSPQEKIRYEHLHKEMRTNIQGIKRAQLAYHAINGSYVHTKAYPREPSVTPQPWLAIESGGFQKLDWAPFGDVCGSYLIRIKNDDFEIIGVMDVDGDGNQATYIATKNKDIYRKTASDVY